MKNFLCILLVQFSFLNAQHGVSSASVSHLISNGISSSNGNNSFNENTIIVEDFMNYHQHQIKIPTKNDVALTIDYDNTTLNSENTFLLQIGLATQSVKNRESVNNVNVALVIDNSGSMNGGKLEKVKNALKVFVKGLKQDDIISIIKFDGEANLVLGSTKIKHVSKNINSIIESIIPEGSTNIHSGMMMGYREAEKFNNKKYNSKVILLTDGMTNTGIKDHEIILRDSKKYNDKGIDISTIGVGSSLDFDLLRKIANAGRGSNYFIGDEEIDIQKTFKDELESLLYNIGKKPKLTIKLPEGMNVKTFYGYQPKFISDQIIEVDIENLDCGQTQVFVMEVEKNKSANTEISTFIEYLKDEKIKKHSEIKEYNASIKSTQKEIIKNYQIAKMSTEIKNAAKKNTDNQIDDAKNIIKNVTEYYQNFCDKNDEDLKRIYNIATKYSPRKKIEYHY